MVLPTVILYLLQDGCSPKLQTSNRTAACQKDSPNLHSIQAYALRSKGKASFGVLFYCHVLFLCHCAGPMSGEATRGAQL